MARRTAPVRTCVGCRERAVAAQLLRVVAVPGPSGFRALPDPARRFPGRGASLHPDQACLALAQRRRAFERSLHIAGQLDLAAVRAYVEEHGRGND